MRGRLWQGVCGDSQQWVELEFFTIRVIRSRLPIITGQRLFFLSLSFICLCSIFSNIITLTSHLSIVFRAASLWIRDVFAGGDELEQVPVVRVERVVEGEEGEERVEFLLCFNHYLHLQALLGHEQGSALDDGVKFVCGRLREAETNRKKGGGEKEREINLTVLGTFH